jgi:hypothetical protein
VLLTILVLEYLVIDDERILLNQQPPEDVVVLVLFGLDVLCVAHAKQSFDVGGHDVV